MCISRRFVHVVLPEDARSSMTRFRWWQPSHSGGGTDQWALDDIRVGHYERRRQIHDDFNVLIPFFFNDYMIHFKNFSTLFYEVFHGIHALDFV